MEILILATSIKNSGYCVAGLDLQNNKLIRLISDDVKSNYALSRKDITYYNGILCTPMHIVVADNLTYSPSANQKENFRIDTSKSPVFSFKQMFNDDIVSFLKKRKVLEPSGNLFMGSKRHFLYENEMKGYQKSLKIYFAKEIYLYQINYDEVTKKTKANIKIGNNIHKKISITDPNYYNCNNLTLTNTILVCSLPDVPYSCNGNNLYFKFIANIIKTSCTKIYSNETEL